MKQFMQAKPRLDETQAVLDTSNYPNSQMDLSYMEHRQFRNMGENMRPNMNFSGGPSGGVSLFSSPVKNVGGGIPRPMVPQHATTITPFGPILPTSFSLAPPEPISIPSSMRLGGYMQSQPPVQPYTIAKSGSLISSLARIGPSMYAPMVVASKSDKGVGTSDPDPVAQANVSEVMSRLLRAESSSSESEEDGGLQSSPSGSSPSPPLRSPDLQSANRRQFGDQVTAVPTPAASAINITVDNSQDVSDCQQAPHVTSPTTRYRRTDRIDRKKEELKQVQRFLEESRAAHDKIYANLELHRVSTRGANRSRVSSSGRRSMSESVTEASNVAQLRRNIADKYTEESVSPHAPVAKPAASRSYQKPAPIATEGVENRKPNPPPASARTPSGSRSPKIPSPDRIVSGVFVSYPRKRRSVSAPHSDNEQRDHSFIDENGSVLAAFRQQAAARRPGGKMNAEEYVELRRNLLNRSEQHAVTNSAGGTGASLIIG